MPSEMLREWLMTCQDQDGLVINIGFGVTVDGTIALLGPPGATVSLSPDEKNELVRLANHARRYLESR